MKKHILIMHETLMESVLSDLFTVVAIGFCVYISQDSTWWTFVTGSMFILVVFVKCVAIVDKNGHNFNSYDEVIAWATKRRKEKENEES